MSNKWLIIIILVVSFLVHFLFFGHPNQTVFDEVHFGKFISGYYTHQYFFDIHPPLGKLIIAGFAKLSNFKPEFSFSQIGDSYPDKQYMVLRFLPSLAGALLPLIIFFLALRLGLSKIASFAAALFMALDNALLVQSKYILMDAFLLLFGFSSLLFYFKYHQGDNWKNLAGMAIFGALAASIKWTGLTFIALAGFIELFCLIKDKTFKNVKRVLNLTVFFTIIPLLIYFSIFVLHFSLLYKTGSGDAFMTPGFQKTLEGSSYQNDATIKQPNLIQKFIELNTQMYLSNQRLTASHPYSSKFYTWPLMIRPIYYWINGSATPGTLEKIYLLGNPIIWWGSTIALLFLIMNMATSANFRNKTSYILIGGWLLNYLPFIGISRVMFLYHYLTSFMFAVLIACYLIDRTKNRKAVFATLLLVCAVSFIYFSPLSYGLKISPKSYENHLWLKTWQ